VNDNRGDVEAVKAAGHPPVAEGVVLVDFDGTLYPFGALFGGEKPLPGARQAVNQLYAMGYQVVIFTSRLSERWLKHEDRDRQAQIDYITNILKRDDIHFHDITSEKYPAEAYFDDKAYRVTETHNLLEAVADFLRSKK